MRPKLCKRCGKEFQGGSKYAYFCPDCVVKSKQENVVRPRKCRECGITFEGGPRARYCPICRAERTRESDRRYHAQGPQRRLGSTDLCQRCGKEYTVMGGLQKYCPDCSKIAVTETDNRQGREYYREHRESISDYRSKVRPVEKRCVICGKTFSAKGTANITCSEECRKEYRRACDRKNYWKRKGEKK